jgi:transposase
LVCYPLRVRQTSEHEGGQVYLPRVNALLFVGVLGVMLTFRSSARLATAYGVSVTGALVIDTLLLLVVARVLWSWAPWKLVRRGVNNETVGVWEDEVWALEVATGEVTGLTQPRHRHQEFLRFLKHVAKAYPDQELHLVMDNYATHKRVEVREWLAANPRIHVHFTPTSGSWLNLVEAWFGIIEKQAIHGGTFASVRDLTAKIPLFINGWNNRCHPFVWTKTADQILTKANRPKNSPTDH